MTLVIRESREAGLWDRVIGTAVADVIGGLSIGWWCDVSDQQVYSQIVADHIAESQYPSS